MLTNIQTYIAKHSTVSIADLSLHFRSDREAIRPMLDKLCRKGRIRKLPASGKCGGCTSCEQGTLELYEWVRSNV
jgi:putative ferrous iron transport protein C